MSEPTRPDLARLKELEAKATRGRTSGLTCALCQAQDIVLTVFANEDHAVLCLRCWDVIRSAIPDLIRWIEHLESRPCASCEELRKERDTLAEKHSALERSLEISRTQTKDAFERVALTHNEAFALRVERDAAREEIGRLKALLREAVRE